MTGTKRPLSDEGEPTRARKAVKKDNGEGSKASKRGAKKGVKGKSKGIPHSTFMNNALPIHVNFTHTPSAVISDGKEPTTSSDPGHIANTTILPSEFSTGSYGWKGSRRTTIQIQGRAGKQEKLQVMISINATVVGSKEMLKGNAGEDEKCEEDAGDEEDVMEDAEE